MRLYSILTESRSERVNIDKAYAFINKNRNCLVNNWSLYRGNNRLPQDFHIVDPLSIERHSPYATNNIYNLLLSNLPSWRQYPKRNKSIICSNSKDRSSGYGTPFTVIVKNNTKIGICPYTDIWDSFVDVGIDSLDNINKLFGELFWEKLEMGVPNTYAELVELLNQLDNIGRIEHPFDDYMFSRKAHKKLFDEDKRFIDKLDDLLSPINNGFELSNSDKRAKQYDTEREIWVDDKCLLVPATLVGDNFLKDIKSYLK